MNFAVPGDMEGLGMTPIDPFAASTVREIERLWPELSQDCTGPANEEAIQAAERELGVRFSNSYRAFLRRFGSGSVNGYEIFGIPGDQLWGGVVMMNQLASRRMPTGCVRFMEDVGDYSHCLDTGRMDESGECPVVVFGPKAAGTLVATSFLEFLRMTKDGLIG
jgi:antitoxin YobK